MRDYQEKFIRDCIEQFKLGKDKLLIEMATGLGKTYTAAHVVKYILQKSNKKVRTLFLAHQIEILIQSAATFKNIFGIGNYSFSACFSGAEPENTDFVFATFDTLYPKIGIISKDKFDIIIVDEAHHSPARTYANVVYYFKPRLLLGLTATPYRVDNKDVLAFFGGMEGHIGKYDLAWALKHEYLAYPKYLVLLDDIDQSKLNQLEMGLFISDLDKRLFLHKKDEEVVKIVEETIKEKNIKNPKGIVFCQSIHHIKYLIKFFLPGSATLAHSQMNDEEKRKNIRSFREDNYHYILVCDLFNEGIDIPEVNILIFMRYTASRTVWLQQLGRGLRKTPNKEYVYALDFVGSLERLNEIQDLAKSIEEVELDEENLEKPFKENDNKIIHDSTLLVSYDRSAAQVLKLIEEFKYRLNSRGQLIEKLRRYVELNARIPDMAEIEKELTDVTCDQIATHFDSYYRFLKTAIPGKFNVNEFRMTCLEYANSYFNKYKIYPSVRAISINTKYNNLPACSEADVIELIGDKINDNINSNDVCLNNKEIKLSEQYKSNSLSQIGCASVKAEMLINKYLGKLKNFRDLGELSYNERQEIREVFHSQFYFLKILKGRAKNG